jgi:folate-binding protein YgfZ
MIVSLSEDSYLIQCNKAIVDDFISKLNIYKLRSQVIIENVDQHYKSFFFNMANEIISSEFNATKGFTIRNDYGFFFNDPRLNDLGIHGIISQEKCNDLAKDLSLSLLDINTFIKIYHNAGLTDLVPADALSNFFSLELNLKELNGISFKKGCFVGQENTARMNLKNKIRKRVFPIQIIEGSVSIDEAITLDEKNIGKIISLDPCCFAVINIEDNKDALNKTIELENSKIKISKPYWLNLN